MKRIEKRCITCNTAFIASRDKVITCSLTCRNQLRKNKSFIENNKKYDNLKENTDYVTCAACGLKGERLQYHIQIVHNMTVSKYKEIYNTPILCETQIKQQSERISGDKNPGYQHGGKFSPFSQKFIGDSKPEDNIQKAAKSRLDNNSYTNTIQYWINKGYTEEDAKKQLINRQTTFSLEICINKYGEEQGRKVWLNRQENWQTTLNSKQPQEIERINRAKMWKGNGYSKISQELFNTIYENIIDKNVYFATLNSISGKNNEYFHISESNKNFFFDFYFPLQKKIIEFDGDYWHGEARGNQQRDIERDNILISEGFKILRIKERDYNKNKQETINKCITFLTQ